jgi:hypothetical protein
MGGLNLENLWQVFGTSLAALENGFFAWMRSSVS